MTTNWRWIAISGILLIACTILVVLLIRRPVSSTPQFGPMEQEYREKIKDLEALQGKALKDIDAELDHLKMEREIRRRELVREYETNPDALIDRLMELDRELP